MEVEIERDENGKDENEKDENENDGFLQVNK
jgi:hypothetical protein